MANRKNSGRGGRKPKAVALKIAAGMRADRIPAGSPEAPGGAPTPPDWLDNFGREDFARMVADVARLGLLSSVDQSALVIHATAYSRWRKAGDEIKAALTVEGAHGGLACHPGVGIQERAERTMLSIEASFGLNPSDRGRLKATEAAGDDFDAFLAGKKA
jgi:P27 family predicted phage terminase small subunit